MSDAHPPDAPSGESAETHDSRDANDSLEQLAHAAARVDVGWSEGRLRAVERKMIVRRTRRTQLRASLAVAAAVLMVIAGSFGWKRFGAHGTRTEPTTVVAQHAPGTAGEPLRFADGSVATPLDPASVVASRVEATAAIDVDLVRGKAHFEVAKNPARLFRVLAGGVSVEVLGTGFDVERSDAGARVSVEHGHVRVKWAGAQADLFDGEAGVFPPPPTATISASSVAASAPSDSASSSATGASSAIAVAPKTTWRSLAREGDFDQAYKALSAEGASAVHDEPGELLLAADVARLSHHPSEAVVHLRRVMQEHAADPRAPLAAFTLGRVLLEELGQPGQAADAFARARALGPSGPLAEDALAREVEAWWRAGATDKAQGRAEEYVKLYPKGIRLRSVRKYGGLDE